MRENERDGRRPGLPHSLFPPRAAESAQKQRTTQRWRPPEQLLLCSEGFCKGARGEREGQRRPAGSRAAAGRRPVVASPPPAAAQCRQIDGYEILLDAVDSDRYGAPRSPPTNRFGFSSETQIMGTDRRSEKRRTGGIRRERRISFSTCTK